MTDTASRTLTPAPSDATDAARAVATGIDPALRPNELRWSTISEESSRLLEATLADPPHGAIDRLGAVSEHELVAMLGHDARVLGILTGAERATPPYVLVFDLDALRDEVWVALIGAADAGLAEAVVAELFDRWPVRSVRELAPLDVGLLVEHPGSVEECRLPDYLASTGTAPVDAEIRRVRREGERIR